MYDAMSAFLKDAILRSYEALGWDLAASVFEGQEIRYPDFELLMEQLSELIDQSDYDAEVKSNYRGALITRIRSLTVGLNKMIFSEKQTAYDKIFDQNCILDISRVKSNETKALIMGLMVYILNEYRADKKTQSNRGLSHITVLEEAHHLLKNTAGTESDLIGKSVEMLTQTIAEIRTYGEGFIIVDQSPSAVDISAIKNTNTKIVLRTPEANDREAVGRSMGLTSDQVNEIAKLPSGVAAVYQNDWVNPVLTMIDKAEITEQPYIASNAEMQTKRTARTLLIKMLLQSWFGLERIPVGSLYNSLNILDLSREDKTKLQELIADYQLFAGNLRWEKEKWGELQTLLQDLLDMNEKEISTIRSPKELITHVGNRMKGLNRKQLQVVCYFLTYGGGDNDD